MDQTDPTPSADPDESAQGAVEAAAGEEGTMPAPTDTPMPSEAAADEPAVEATVPGEEPVDGAPTPLATPAEGPVHAVAHDASARPKPVMAKVTPVLAAVAIAWVVKKLFSRNRA